MRSRPQHRQGRPGNAVGRRAARGRAGPGYTIRSRSMPLCAVRGRAGPGRRAGGVRAAPAAGGRASRRRADESGGAVSLWVVLMVPVSAFAAVVAMAGPQRLAAESSMDEAAEDLATLAVAWRDGQSANPSPGEGPLHAFPPECRTADQPTRFDTQIEEVELEIARREGVVEGLPAGDEKEFETENLEGARGDRARLLGNQKHRRAKWEEACDLVFESIWRDLGNLGVDMSSLRGFYSDSLAADGTDERLPCKISERVVVEGAVHVALSADWQHAGWAAAQVWPDGTRIGAESIGRLRRNVARTDVMESCGEGLDVLDEQGRSRAVLDPGTESRKLSESARQRTVFEG